MGKKKPVLVVMAAGMGSRYGGMKQIDPVDEYGHIIIDFSIYDAVRAGFEKVVFIIKKENEELFREGIGARISKKVEVAYVYQDLNALPDGFSVPDDCSIVTYNNTAFSESSTPPLDSIEVYLRESAREAAFALERLWNVERLPRKIVVPCSLVVRGSVKKER